MALDDMSLSLLRKSTTRLVRQKFLKIHKDMQLWYDKGHRHAISLQNLVQSRLHRCTRISIQLRTKLGLGRHLVYVLIGKFH